MSERIPQSVAKRVVFRAFLTSDHVSVATGKTIAITISKNGGAFGNPAAGATNATEISSGYYYFDLGTGDTGTLGPLAWRGAEGTIDDAGDAFNVVNATNAGFSALPNAAADAAGGLPISDAGGLDLDAQVGTKINDILTDTGTTLQGELDGIQADTEDIQSRIPLTRADGGVLATGTAAAIANGSITLASGHAIAAASSVLIELTGGTNAKGKSRIGTYSGTGDVFNVDPAWNAAGEALPSGTITYSVMPLPPAPTSSVPAVNVTQSAGTAITSSGGRMEVNTTHWAGTAVASANVLIDGAITAAKIASDAFTAAKFATGCLTAAKFAANALDAVWSTATRILTAGTNIVLAKGTGVTGFNDLSAAQVNAEVDTALTDYDGPTNTEMEARTLAAASYATAASIAALNNLSAAQVNAEVVDALATDTYAEPSAVPAATASLAAKIGYLAAWRRNKITQTATTQSLRNDADSADIASVTVSDDGTTFTKAEDV